MKLSDLKQLERIRVLRRDRHAARLAQLRTDFEPIDGSLAAQEATLKSNIQKTGLLNLQINGLSQSGVSEIFSQLEAIETQLNEQKEIEALLNEAHQQRLTLLAKIRAARNDWRNAGRACDRWNELITLSATVSDYNERVAEENSSSEAIFYISKLRT